MVFESDCTAAFDVPGTAPAPADALLLYVTPGDVKACIRAQHVKQAVCVARFDRKHVDRAFVRQLVRDARAKAGPRPVHVRLPASLSWADAVRALDGARTCCSGDSVALTSSLGF